MEAAVNQDYPINETFEQLIESMKEFRTSLKELRADMNELKAKNEPSVSFEEIRKLQRETAEQMKETDRRIGEMSNRFGEIAEHLVAPGIADKFYNLGYCFNLIGPGGIKVIDENKKVIAQVDILLENSDCIMAVEVKTKPKIQDIAHNVKRMEILREYRYKQHDKRKIHGAIAGVIFGDVEKKAAIESGFFVLEQTGDTMKIDMPDNFIPREW
jgi:Sec-independent protein translocase protein TatA